MAIPIRFSPEDRERLELVATKPGRSKTFYIREAIHECLDDLEERYGADTVIRDWESSGNGSYPAEELSDEVQLPASWRTEHHAGSPRIRYRNCGLE
jgi:RHH-type rel operon transcriptional repressor/antitoxin RelB